MIIRYHAKCDNCEKSFNLRVSVPKYSNDKFLFPCPYCKLPHSGNIQLSYDSNKPSMSITPKGFSLNKYLIDNINESTVTISTELPVHKIFHSNSLLNGGSPFLWFKQEFPNDKINKWYKNIQMLHQISENKPENLEKIISFAEINNWDQVNNLLKNQLGFSPNEIQTIYIFYRSLNAFYIPLIDFDTMVGTLKEYFDFLNNCFQNHNSAYKDLLAEFQSKYGFDAFRSKLYNVYLRILENVSSFAVGLLYDEMPPDLKNGMKSQYRLFRNDYDIVKSLYQDIFELNSKIMLFMASPVNLATRGDKCSFYTGITSCKKFSRQVAAEKFKILEELPQISLLVNKVSRPMRNKIGHFSAIYNFRTGNIILDDSSEISYIEFLSNFLNAVRSVWFMLAVVEKIDIDIERVKS